MAEQSKYTRRTFLGMLSAGAATVALTSTGFPFISDKVYAASNTYLYGKQKPISSFSPLSSHTPSKVIAANGYTIDTLFTAENNSSSNNSFCSFIANANASSDNQGILLSSSEANGITLQNIFQDISGKWSANEKIAALKSYPSLSSFTFVGTAAGTKGIGGATRAAGLAGNQFGSQTPWNTILLGESKADAFCQTNGIPLTHCGWVTEIDPTQKVKTTYKHTNLGRFNHGAIYMTKSSGNKAVVYLGSNDEGGCLFKFISDVSPSSSMALSAGKLYAANIETGEWLLLDIKRVKDILNNLRADLPNSIIKKREQLQEQFQDQSDVLIYAQEAALILGATPLDCPAGIHYHKPDNALYVTLTGNKQHGNLLGSVVKITENNKDTAALKFTYQPLDHLGICNPSTMQIDGKGNIYIASNITPDKVGTGFYQPYKSNGIFIIKPSGKVGQFLAVPENVVVTSFYLSPNGQTLFTSINDLNKKQTKTLAIRAIL